MLKGTSAAILAENARTAKRSGLSQSAAISLSARRQSLSERESKIREAVRKKFQPPAKKAKDAKQDGCCCGPLSSSPYPYCKEIYDTHVIMEQGDKLYHVPITWNGNDPVVGEKTRGRMVFQPDAAASAASDNDADDE